MKTTDEKVLQGAGTISHAQAIEKATEEYRKYQVQNLSPVEEEYLESIKNIHSTVKKNIIKVFHIIFHMHGIVTHSLNLRKIKISRYNII